MARGSPLNDQERAASSTPSLVSSRESSMGISDISLLWVDQRGVEPARGGLLHQPTYPNWAAPIDHLR